MTHTPTLPPDDRGMWRHLVSRSHPDAICDEELGGEAPGRERREQPLRRRETSTSSAGEYIPFDQFADFKVLTDRALSMAEAVAEPFGFLLRQVAYCYPVSEGPLYKQQCRGASYRSLGAIGHMVGMTKAERVQWYSIAEAVPLTQRYAGHILSRLKRRAA
jgi:hypothetical protein